MESLFVNAIPKEPLDFPTLLTQEGVDENTIKSVQEALSQNRNIIIFGATGAGKTTALECILRESSKHYYKRNIYICDIPEVKVGDDSFIVLENECRNWESPKSRLSNNISEAILFAPDYLFIDQRHSGHSLSQCESANSAGIPLVLTTYGRTKEEAIERLKAIAALDYQKGLINQYDLEFVNKALFISTSRSKTGERTISLS